MSPDLVGQTLCDTRGALVWHMVLIDKQRIRSQHLLCEDTVLICSHITNALGIKSGAQASGTSLTGVETTSTRHFLDNKILSYVRYKLDIRT